jgi:hypothetical protein
VDVEFADLRGNFFGSLSLKNKNDFGMMIIEEGLGQVNIVGNKKPYNIE